MQNSLVHNGILADPKPIPHSSITEVFCEACFTSVFAILTLFLNFYKFSEFMALCFFESTGEVLLFIADFVPFFIADLCPFVYFLCLLCPLLCAFSPLCLCGDQQMWVSPLCPLCALNDMIPSLRTASQ